MISSIDKTVREHPESNINDLRKTWLQGQVTLKTTRKSILHYNTKGKSLPYLR